MTKETLTVVIEGRNLQPLKKAFAEDQVRALRVFNEREKMEAAEGEPVIERIRLLPESNPAEEIDKLKTFNAALKKSGFGDGQ